jgi:DNA (cytosine-5)-methyltransferase 1
MIFELVTSCQNKGLFKELILTYVRIAESCAEKLKVKMHRPKMCNVAIVNEMRAIGVIDSNKDISSLLNLLGESLFNRFVAAVDLAVENPEVVGSLLNKLSNKKRQSLQRAEARSKKPTFVDFFAGAGGLSKGFTDAGYRVVFANDFQDVCVSTYRFNHPELPADRVSSQDVRKIVDDIGRYINRDVDVVVGGPPCQGFSSANKQPVIDDPRNELYKYFLKAINELLPKFVVMENVKGMLSVANQVVDHYK